MSGQQSCVNCGRGYVHKHGQGSNMCGPCTEATELAAKPLMEEIEDLRKKLQAAESLVSELRARAKRGERDSQRLDFLILDGDFQLGQYNGPDTIKNATESLWFFRSASVYTAPGPFKPFDVRTAIDRAMEPPDGEEQ